ncbi:MAG: hypothetical protein ACI9FB_002696, partial [Candidatus Azotimanducaceae bacterium]
VRSGNSFFSNREQIGTSSQSHDINVKPKPESFVGGDWLPAKSLQLNESWLSGSPAFSVGEPINRTLTLIVEGLAVSLIPPITDTEIDGAKTYRDPPVETQEVNNDGINSMKVITIGIVPTQPGMMIIPEIRLPWWNTDTNQMEVAIVPESRFEVSGLVQTNTQPTLAESLPITQENLSSSTTTTSSSLWKIIAAIMSTLWLGTLLLWWRKPRTQKKEVEPVQAPRTSQSALFKDLLNRCKNNQSDHILNSLFIWGKTKYPEIDSISGLLKVVRNEQFSKEIQGLEQALYSKETDSSWNGDNLAKVLREVDNIEIKQTKTAALTASLNPA